MGLLGLYTYILEIYMKKTVNKGGRPRKTMLENINMRERRQQVDLGKLLVTVEHDIILLRGISYDPDATNAQVAALKAALLGTLALINKVLPDLKAHEHTGEIGVKHSMKPVDRLELATRFALFRRDNQDVIEDANDRVFDGKVVKLEDVTDVEPEYEWL